MFHSYGYGYYDPTMIILIPAILLSLYAQFKVSSTTNRYLRVNTMSGFSGYEAARRILDSNNLYDVDIRVVQGNLSDHYDPRNRTLSLSQDVYYGKSITSVAIAAHECGHAIQHAKHYAPLTLRSSLVPAVNFASNISWFLILIGMFMYRGIFLQIGIALFSLTVIFQLVTLPVEFNASSRAIVQLENLGIIYDEESRQSKKVLSAAALTYVAAALTSVLQLLRLLLILQRNDD